MIASVYICLSFILLLSDFNYWGVADLSIVVEAKKKKKFKNVDHSQFPLPRIPHDSADGDTPRIELHELDKFITDATSYLLKISHTKEQDSKFPGRFTYQANLMRDLNLSLRKNYWNPSRNHQDDYNLLRHNGAIYALAQAYIRIDKNKNSLDKQQRQQSLDKILQTIERGIGYLRENALLPVPGRHDEWLAAWERDEINDPQSEPTTAKLGGAGLALIALGHYEQIKPGRVDKEKELRRLGAFIESLQDENDGSFTCKYHWHDGPDNSWQSLYYPGEAALGLVILAELEETTDDEFNNNRHERQKWITVSARALLYLERYRRNLELEDIEPDHWALLATAKLLPILAEQIKQMPYHQKIKKNQANLEYWLIYNHGVRVAASMVADHTYQGLKEHDGCFTYDYRTCPTSTRLEGLLAALTFIQESEVFFGEEEGDGSDGTEPLRDRIERDVAMGIRFLLNAQQNNDKNNMRGAVPGISSSGGDAFSSGSEDEDDKLHNTEVRIDYVQHSMSAMMAYESYLIEKQKKQQLDSDNGNGVHHYVNQKVHKVADHIIHKATNIQNGAYSSTIVNYVLLGLVLFFILMVICIAYDILPLLSNRQHRRRFKRQD